MSKIGNIYVEIRGDYTKYKEDIQELKVTAKVDGAKVSDALNNAITPAKASAAINQLNADLRQLSGAAKAPADNFKTTADAISKDLGKIATSAGLTTKEFSALTEKMLQTQAQKATERSFNDIAKAAGLSHAELSVLGKQLGFSTEQMGKLGISLGGTNKDMGAQQTLLGSLQKNWVGFSIGINQAMEVIGKIYRFTQAVVDFGEAGAEVERVERSFAAVASAAGLHGETVIRGFKNAAQGLMDEGALMEKASRLIQENIPVEVIENLIRALAKQAPIVGETLPQAYEKFSNALLTGNMKTVNLYTGTVDLDEIYEKYAKSIGVTREELSEEAKIKIRAIEITDLLTKKTEGLDTSYEGASEKIQRAKVKLQDMKEELEKKTIPWTLAYYDALNKVIGAINDLSNRPAPEWVLRQKYGSQGSGASGSWGPSANYTLDDATANMRPLELSVKLDPAKVKKELDDLKRMELAYTKSILNDKSELAEWETKATIADEEKAWKEMVKRLQAGDESTRAPWDPPPATSFNEFKAEIDKRFDYGKDEYEKAAKDMEAHAPWETLARGLADYTNKVSDRWKMEKTVNEEIGKLTNNEFESKRKSIEDQAALYRLGGVEREKVALWVALRMREIDEEELLQKGTFWDGVKVQYDRNMRDQITWAEQGAKLWQGTFGPGGALEGTLNTFFDDLFAGELKTAEDYFKAFTDAILKMFAQMIAQMIAQWAAAQLGNLISGALTGGGGGGSSGGSLTSSALNTAISKGGSAIYDYVFGAGTSAAGTAGAAALGSYAGEAGAMAGAMAEAGATGTAIGAGALASAGIAAWAAAPIIGSIWAYNKGKAEQIYGLNPFADPYGPAVMGANATLSMQVADVNMLDWYKSNLPSVEAFRARWKAETGMDAPLQARMLKGQADPYINWMARQPEILAAQQEYITWFNNNYRWNDMGGAESQGFWEKIDRHARPNIDNVTYAAEGGVIDEPMIAIGRHSRRKMVIGEAGREFIIPEREINRILQEQKSMGLMEPWGIGEPIAHRPSWSNLWDSERYATNKRNQQNLERTTKETLMMPWLRESVMSGRYGNPNWKAPSGEGGGLGMPLNITLNLDGKAIGDVLLKISTLGVKVVSQRGIVAN